MHPDTAHTILTLAAQSVIFAFFVIVVAVFVDRLLELGEFFRRRHHLKALKAVADAKLKSTYERHRRTHHHHHHQ